MQMNTRCVIYFMLRIIFTETGSCHFHSTSSSRFQSDSDNWSSHCNKQALGFAQYKALFVLPVIFIVTSRPWDFLNTRPYSFCHYTRTIIFIPLDLARHCVISTLPFPFYNILPVHSTSHCHFHSTTH